MGAVMAGAAVLGFNAPWRKHQRTDPQGQHDHEDTVENQHIYLLSHLVSVTKRATCITANTAQFLPNDRCERVASVAAGQVFPFSVIQSSALAIRNGPKIKSITSQFA